MCRQIPEGVPCWPLARPALPGNMLPVHHAVVPATRAIESVRIEVIGSLAIIQPPLQDDVATAPGGGASTSTVVGRG